jgi:hypothetical protein
VTVADRRADAVRWAWIGKLPGQRGEYTVLAADDTGPGRQHYYALARELVRSNPGSAAAGQVDALPWVYFAPVATGAGSRTAVASMEWPVEEVRDSAGRPATLTRYYDVDPGTVTAVGAGYESQYQALTRENPQDGAAFAFRGSGLVVDELAAFIAAFDTDTVIRAAALLLEGPVVITPEESLAGLPARLRCLDAVLALLPYGIRDSLATGTWTPNDSPHDLRLAFSNRVMTGQHAVRRGEPITFRTRVAVDYAHRISRLIGGGTRRDIAALLAKLWADRRPYSVHRPDEVLDSLADLDRVYAVYQDLLRQAATAGTVVELMRQPESELGLVEPEITERLVQEVLARGDDPDLTVLARYWSIPMVPAMVVGAALTTAETRMRAIWRVAVAAGQQNPFLQALIADARAGQEVDQVVAFLTTTGDLPFTPALRQALLNRPAVASRILTTAYLSRGNATARWAGLLFDGQTPLPLWAEPFAAMRSGRAELTREQAMDKQFNGSRTALALLAVAADAQGADVFLACVNAWSILHNQLQHRDPGLVQLFLRIDTTVGVASADSLAALDLLRLAAGVPLRHNPAGLEPDHAECYLRGLDAKLTRLEPQVTREYAAGLATEVTSAVLDRRGVAFLLKVAEHLPGPPADAVLQRLAERATIYPAAIADVSPDVLRSLVDRVPGLGVQLARTQLSDAVNRGLNPATMIARCVQAQSEGLSVVEILTEIRDWPGLDDHPATFRLIDTLAAEAPRLGLQPLRAPGLAHVLEGHCGEERARSFARWLATQADQHRREADFLTHTLKKHKPPKEESRGLFSRTRTTSAEGAPS